MHIAAALFHSLPHALNTLSCTPAPALACVYDLMLHWRPQTDTAVSTLAQ
jgi:hypothetical protein